MIPLKNYAEIAQKLEKIEMLEKLRPKKKTVDKSYVFLTINPFPEIELSSFIKKFENFVKTTKLFQENCAVIEQRGNSPETLGKGFHAHVLFKRYTPLGEGYPPTDLTRKLRDIWKKFTNVKNTEIFNIQFIPLKSGPKQPDAQEKLEYILSTKTGKGKKEKQDFDVEFRKLHDLPSYYGNADILL